MGGLLNFLIAHSRNYLCLMLVPVKSIRFLAFETFWFFHFPSAFKPARLVRALNFLPLVEIISWFCIATILFEVIDHLLIHLFHNIIFFEGFIRCLFAILRFWNFMLGVVIQHINNTLILKNGIQLETNWINYTEYIWILWKILFLSFFPDKSIKQFFI